MEERKLYKTITSPDDFKNPIYCYIIVNQLENAFEESFEDSGGNWPNVNKFLDWLLQNNHIAEEQYTKIKSTPTKDLWNSCSYLFGCGGSFSLVQNGYDFPAYNKGHQLLCDYISEHEEERIKLYKTVYENYNYDPESDDEEDTLEGITYHGYWNKKSYRFLIQDIYQDDMDINTITKEIWLKDDYTNEKSYTDEYNFLKEMSIAEADYHAKYKGNKI